MEVVYSEAQALHNPPFEMEEGGRVNYPERRKRIASILDALRTDDRFALREPDEFSDDYITDVHDKAYIDKLRAQSESFDESSTPYSITNTDSPIDRYTFTSARASVNSALTGAAGLLMGEQLIYSLCRPPGHHADCNHSGGYCHFNNAAIAAEYLSGQGKVSVLDIDFHHGDGTQNIFYDRSDVQYVSLHADPHRAYPWTGGMRRETGRGEGIGLTSNYPLPITTNERQYLKALSAGLEDIKSHKPEFLIVSAGFDTHKDDPIAGFQLDTSAFEAIAKDIAQLGLPTLVVQEGGYNLSTLGTLVRTFLTGLDTAA